MTAECDSYCQHRGGCGTELSVLSRGLIGSTVSGRTPSAPGSDVVGDVCGEAGCETHYDSVCSVWIPSNYILYDECCDDRCYDHDDVQRESVVVCGAHEFSYHPKQ